MDCEGVGVDFFSEALVRLKHQLRVSKDGEVATALGLSKTAFSERKKRGSFPEAELRTLARDKPELQLDPDLVLFGVDDQVRNARENWRQAQDLARDKLRGDTVDAVLRSGDKVMLLEMKEPPSSLELSYDELALLQHWRRCGAADRMLVLQLATRLAHGTAGSL